MSQQPLILVINDDGVTAPGIKALMEAMRTLGNVVVVAPDQPQSGMGHAVTIDATLRLNKLSEEEGLTVYSCSGTPVDCVKLAVNVVLPQPPDVVVSGINHGANHSINVLYSGTMSAAIEAAMEGIPAVGFSLTDHSIDADFSASAEVAKQVTKALLEKGLDKGYCLNVNIPKLPLAQVMGMKVCRQAHANWVEKFDERKDPSGRSYYWLTGEFVNYDAGEDTDVKALADGYVSIVPIQYDLTAHGLMQELRSWNL